MINVILTTLGLAGNKSYNHPCNAKKFKLVQSLFFSVIFRDVTVVGS